MSGSASAPASSANLGPGFDFLAIAFELRCRVTAWPSDEWDCPPEAAPIVRQVTAALGQEVPFAVDIDSDIPVGRGLGSSAALAVAAGAAAVRALGGQVDPAALFRAATATDGHPDNAAAAVYGGLVAVAGNDVHSFELAPTLIPLLAVPNTTLSTAEARDALPATVPLAAAARTAARAAFLVQGLRTADAAALAAAAGDELHEAPRAYLSPLTADLVAAARTAGALHASWSGAGPSVVALATSATRDAVATALTKALGDEGAVLAVEVATAGVV